MVPGLHRAAARLVGALALGACALAGAMAATIPPGTALAAKQEMVRNNGGEPESLDPALTESTAAGNILLDLFEGLTTIDNHARVVPGVAQSWRQVDATTWVFKLRKNAQWSNGEPLTAQDFVYSLQRLVDPKTAAPLGAVYGAYFVNGDAIAQGKLPPAALGVRAIDPSTLELKTAGPVSFMPELMSQTQLFPVPRATVEKFGIDWTKPANIVCNGAYMLKDWQVNSKIVVDRNARYWDAAGVVLMRTTYLPVEDGNADLKLYQSGENDMMLRVPPGAYLPLKAQYPKEMHNSLLIAMRFYVLNTTDPLLKDVRVRKALTMVVDRDILAGKVTADGEVPLYGMAVKGSTGVDPVRYDWADWPMDRRVAEARRLLAAAGVKPGTRLRFAYNNSDFHKKMAIFTASEWKTKLGLDTDIDSMEQKVLMRKSHDGVLQIVRKSWTPGYADITGFLQLVQCGAVENDSRICDKAADDLIHQASAQSDPVRRQALMTQATRLEMDDYPQIPLLQMSVPRLVKPWIGGYDDANDQDAFRSKDFYVIKH